MALPDDDYAQSANVLFHFMSKIEYLEDALCKHALIPRYCMEDLGYLNLTAGGIPFQKALVLQKCFCDIPFHKLMEPFRLDLPEDSTPPLTAEERSDLARRNTHPDCYGQYAIAFSKKWGEGKHLQPIHYINGSSDFVKGFRELFEALWSAENLPDECADDIISRLSFMKPLRGTMDRVFERHSGENIVVKICKNFHDEREWRYVPSTDVLSQTKTERIIANPTILCMPDFQRNTNANIATEGYKALWLDFQYDEIRYLIVPNSSARIELMDYILSLPNELFADSALAFQSKLVLISKILVLEEIRKDW